MMLRLAIAALTSVATTAPAPAASTFRFSYYEMLTPLARPCDLTTDPNGAIWFEDVLVDKIAHIDPNTGVVKKFTTPYTSAPSRGIGETTSRGALGGAIQPGLDGNIYEATVVRNQFLKINPITKNITIFNPKIRLETCSH